MLAAHGTRSICMAEGLDGHASQGTVGSTLGLKSIERPSVLGTWTHHHHCHNVHRTDAQAGPWDLQQRVLLSTAYYRAVGLAQGPPTTEGIMSRRCYQTLRSVRFRFRSKLDDKINDQKDFRRKILEITNRLFEYFKYLADARRKWRTQRLVIQCRAQQPRMRSAWVP